jgi:hypothetical protein
MSMWGEKGVTKREKIEMDAKGRKDRGREK